MKLVKFGSLEDLQDGEYLFVVAPNGFLVLCWYSRKGFLRPEVNYGLSCSNVLDYVDEVPYDENTLVCRVGVE